MRMFGMVMRGWIVLDNNYCTTSCTTITSPFVEPHVKSTRVFYDKLPYDVKEDTIFMAAWIWERDADKDEIRHMLSRSYSRPLPAIRAQGEGGGKVDKKKANRPSATKLSSPLIIIVNLHSRASHRMFPMLIWFNYKRTIILGSI